jgi:hypothetical protein
LHTFRATFIADPRRRRSARDGRDEITPEIKKMIDELDALREQTPKDAGEWPLGPRPGHEKPSF